MTPLWHLLLALPDELLLTHWEDCRREADDLLPWNDIPGESVEATAAFRSWEIVRAPRDGGDGWRLCSTQQGRPLLVYRDGDFCRATFLDLVVEEVGS